MLTKDHPKKLFLLDAYALIYRSYFAFIKNPRINSKGLNTSAVFGFTNTLLEILYQEKPTHIAVVFDTAAPTERHVEFEAYKAQREEMPEDLKKAIPYVFQLLEALNIHAIGIDGYEADDVVGTMAKQAEQKGFLTYMMTPDKDYGQLVSENIFIYKPARMGNGAEIMGIKEVCEKWDIQSVDQLIEILGLMGDASDNIPGIPGVGEKTAIQYVKDFGSIENLIANTDKLKGKAKEKVEQGKDLAIISKKLATIITDVPYTWTEEELILKDLDKDKTRELFKELEFRQLAQKLLGEDLPVASSPKKASTNKATGPDLFSEVSTSEAIVETPVAETEMVLENNFNTIENTPHTYHLVKSEDEISGLLALLKSSTEYAFDTETTSLDIFDVEIVGMSFSVKTGEAYYVPCSANQSEALALLKKFEVIFHDTTKTLVGQNIKYDLQILANYGVEIKNKLFDTMLAHFLIQPEMRHGMNVLSETYLNYSPVKIDTLIGKKGADQMNMRDVEETLIKEYAAEDADVTLQLKQRFLPKLQATKTESLFESVEVPLLKVLSDMEREGVHLDVPFLNDYSKLLETDIIEKEKRIYEMAGKAFNIGSPKQVGEVLFDHMKIGGDKVKKTKTGQYATGEDVLVKLAAKNPIVDEILNYRELNKLKSTYVDALPILVKSKTNRLHTTFNQVVAVTGRLSSDNPNLQNIPIRTERGREIRKAFIPRNNDYTVLSADYSQIELRLMAEVSKDEGMLEAFLQGTDIHQATAAKVYGVGLDEVTREMRSNAKMVNFGIIYGISAFGLSERLNIARGEAAEIIQNYFAKYSGVKKYMDDAVNNAREKGYVETILGRRRYLRDINSANATVRGFAERNAINAPIQGSAADMIKIAMINIQKEFKEKNFKSKMVLQVHDELVFDAHKDELATIKPIIENHMKFAIKTVVPIEVGMGEGENWLKAH
jgi:DNA polymerase I